MIEAKSSEIGDHSMYNPEKKCNSLSTKRTILFIIKLNLSQIYASLFVKLHLKLLLVPNVQKLQSSQEKGFE